MEEIIRPILSKVQYKKRTFFERRLPQSGELSCRVGEVVRPFDILGSTFVSLDKRSWRLNASEWAVKVSDGNSLSAGDVLLQKKSWLPFRSSVVRMPFSGTVSAQIEGGVVRIDIASLPEKFNLVSGISARVSKVIDKLSVLLETEAYVVSGAYGNGRDAVGEIKVVGDSASPLLLSQITSELTGKIVVGSSFVSPEVTNKAQALGVVALIVGGTSTQSVRAGLPILVTEGFGHVPMSREIFDFLRQSQLKTAVVWPQRRQLIVPEEGGNRLAKPEETLDLRRLVVGDRVQVFAWPNFGCCGGCLAIGKTSVRLPSGLFDHVVKVGFDSGEVAEVPISNVIILG